VISPTDVLPEYPALNGRASIKQFPACAGIREYISLPAQAGDCTSKAQGFSPEKTYLMFRLLLSLVLFFCFVPAHAQAPLAPALDKILNAPTLKGGVTGAIVCRVSDGKVLYVHDPDLRLMPASNRKLFTSAAALELLGPGFQVHTDLLAAAKPGADGVIPGDLYLRGGGDGLLSPADLDTMAAALAEAGVKRIDGGIVGDGSRFTDGPYGFGWEWDDFSDEEFPQISALEVNEGVLGVHVAPGALPGDPVTASLDPPTDYVPLVITAKTGAKEAVNDCAVSRPWDKNEFEITGTLPVGQILTQDVPVQAPPLLAATLLRADLERHGIAVTGSALIGPTPPGAVTLASHSSLPLDQYIVRMNKPSDNLLAESLVRLLDSRGTYEAGHARETPFFQSLGVDTTPIALVDGCGVGRRNYVTARSVSQLLIGMHRKKDWLIYYNSLPIAGVDGTLKSRMIGTPAQNNVHAKTGTLSQARALSGYVTSHRGQLYVFSLLMNNFPGNARSAGTVQDQFVEWLAAHL
jgi:D-alanyl-D-alanine carboxypeptidase/D-alanyl-D-alanine-endopeptidase (penicillin-binding protein 4)